MDTDRNLLFGVLALQADLLTPVRFAEACSAWAASKHAPLADLLVERGWLSPSDRADVDKLLQRKLAKHGGDVKASLAEATTDAIRQSLVGTDDPDVRRSLTPPAGHILVQTTDNVPEARERYTLSRLHATGGIGRVWLARDQKLGSDVALKELRPERADQPAVWARFLLEARVTGQLEHPGIVPVYELDRRPDDNAPFYTMRFVRGRTLAEAARTYHERQRRGEAGPLELRELTTALVGVCNAVAYAHDRGVLHRDLKPQNVVLGDYGEVMVLDWGLARVAGEADGNAVPVAAAADKGDSGDRTVAGQVLGTPAYMAPEQAEGRLDLLDARADVYGLGAVLYEVLTGRPPFAGPDTTAVLRQVVHEPPPPPRTAVPETPRALEAVCLKALAKRPVDRYASAKELAAELHRWLADEPVAVYREPLATRLTRWGRRHRTLATGAGALLVTAVLSLAIITVLIGREQAATERQRARAVAAAESLRREDYIHRINLADRELSVDNLRRALELLGDCPPDLRDWEWDYLNRLCRVEPTVLRATAEVHCVAFRPDGEQMAASEHGTVKVLDSRTGRVVQTLHDHDRGHRGAVFALAFSPDGRHLALASEDRTVRLWDLAAGREVFRRSGQVGESQGLAYSVAFSPDGRHLVAGSEVAGSEVGLAIVWDVADGSEVYRLPGHEKAAECVAFSPDGRLLATGSWAGVLRIWDARTGRLLCAVPAHGQDRISAVAFHPDGRSLATASFDRTVKLWDATTGVPIKTLTGHPGFISGLAFSRDGRRLASVGGEDKAVKIWDPLTGRELLNLRGHTDACNCVAFSPDGRRLVSASNDRTIRIWDATALTGSEGLESLTREHDDEVASVAFSPDGGSLASSSWNKTVWLWDAQTGALLRTFQNPGRVFRVVFSPDGRQLAAAGVSPGRTAFVKVWDTATGGEVGATIREESMPFSVAFDPDGRYLVKEGPGHTVKVWDARTRDPLGEIGRHEHQIWGMKFSPDGRRLATASIDGMVRVWAWDPARLGRLQAPELTLRMPVIGFGDRVAFSPDGKRLATGGEEHTVKVWDAKTGAAQQTLRGHTGDVFAVAFDRRGRWLASAGQDTTVRLWDTTTSPWELRHTLRGHTSFVMGLAFSPDGSRLVSGSRDRTLKVWDLARLVQRP